MKINSANSEHPDFYREGRGFEPISDKNRNRQSPTKNFNRIVGVFFAKNVKIKIEISSHSRSRSPKKRLLDNSIDL